MTHEQAQKILNKVREGVHYPAAIINQALILTGDLDANENERSEGVVDALSAESENRWTDASSRLVGRRYFGH